MKYIIPLFIIFLSACTTTGNNMMLKTWEYRDIDVNLTQAEVESEDQKQIVQLIEEYRRVPFEGDYSEVIFSKKLLSSGGMKYYFFDVRYVDDMQAVFQFDMDGNLISNFLYSSF